MNQGRGIGKVCGNLETNPKCDPIDCVVDTNVDSSMPNDQCIQDSNGKYYKNKWNKLQTSYL
jgi:hypothetical protein